MVKRLDEDIALGNESRKFEKVATSIYENSIDASYKVASEIAELIIKKAASNEYAVLGLATGSTPIKVYEFLVDFHKNQGLSFANVITFNLDEYFPIQPDAIQSYVRFMNEHLFNHVDIDRKNVHIPDGTLAKERIKEYCEEYEQKINYFGGIDIQILGIGRTGHVGFNEPGSSRNSLTRLIRLDKITRQDAASDFFGSENVPASAITMGVGSIMKAKKIFLMAWGEGKASIIKSAVEGEVSESVPASFLQHHEDCTFILDSAGASELTRIKTPWLVGECEWNKKQIKKAVIWLSERLGKAVLKITNEDYNEYGMSSLIADVGSAEEVNLRVFNELQHTITGWPGGKPNEDDRHRPERAKPFPKRVLIFSPHPDDDVISMGGTMLRLVDQGHDVHIAYQTSGNIAVFDDEVLRFLDFVSEAVSDHNAQKEVSHLHNRVRKFLKEKHSGQIDSLEIQYFKGLIRKGEALAACRYCNIPENKAHFLNLPFYQTGTVKKNPYNKQDLQITMDLLEAIKPHQIFAAGDLSDPHGTHRVCLQIILKALEMLKEKARWLKDTYLWLYRGAWQEWDMADMDMVVPIGPKDLTRKRNAIFKHQSQKDKAMFPGSDNREFWQRAEQRNRHTAEKYDKLGFAEYEAMEGFVKYDF